MSFNVISVVGPREQGSLPGAGGSARGRLPPRQPGHQAPPPGQDHRSDQLLRASEAQQLVVTKRIYPAEENFSCSLRE